MKKPRLTKQQVNELLDKAMVHVKSVPYEVTLRWLFYRLLQEGVDIKDKKDYKNFTGLLARARHSNRRGWKPNTLIDDTRAIIWNGVNSFNEEEWLKDLKIEFDKFQNQDYFIIILFEAKAMYRQFAHYTKNIPLLAFGGDPSIYSKWKVVTGLVGRFIKYGKPIKILYFGDCDKKGNQIYTTAKKHIIKWCKLFDLTEEEFEFIYCGLTPEQANALNLLSDPNKPNKYQWEALTDEQAKDIIIRNVKPFQDESKFKVIEKQEKKLLNKIKRLLKPKKK